MNGSSKVSVIVTTYNRPELLRRALKSVQNQLYANWECIIVNDGGKDVSDVIDELQDGRFRYFDHSHVGRPRALNTALEQAIGDYIAYLDDDDEWFPEHLKICVDFLEAEPSIGVVYTKAIGTSYTKKTDGTEQVMEDFVEPLSEFDRSRLRVYNWIPNLTVVHRANLIRQAGSYRDLPVLEDWDFLLRLATFAKFAHLPRITGEYKIDVSSGTRNRAMWYSNASAFRDIVTTIRRSYPNLQVGEKMKEGSSFSERDLLYGLFAGTGMIGLILRLTSYYYLYAHRFGHRAAMRHFFTRAKTRGYPISMNTQPREETETGLTKHTSFRLDPGKVEMQLRA